MSDELVKVLRETDFSYGCPCGAEPLCKGKDCVIIQAADAIEELSKQNEEWEEVVKTALDFIPCWSPVTERLPENGAEVLAWCESGFAYVDWWLDGEWKVTSLVDGKYEHVTHWMPLPEPPKEVYDEHSD